MTDFVVLNFHGIGSPERALEPREAPYWLSTNMFTAVLDRIAVHPRRERIRITFDDGNRSDKTIAMPMLCERELTAEFFVLTARLDRPGSLSREDIGALLAAGMGVGSHGTSHLDWTELGENALANELRGSRVALEVVCGRPVTTAGIPFGRYNMRVLRALRVAGYEVAYSSDTGSMREEDFPRARTSVRNDWPDSVFDDLLHGREGAVRRMRRRIGRTWRRWLV